jgi:hypothetical protein
MYRKLQAKLLTGIALGVVIAVLAPIASASSSPDATVTIPARLARIQYPGTSSQPTVYMAGRVTIPAWLTRIQYPGTYPGASVVFPRVQSSPRGTPVVAPARSFDWAAFGIGIAAATGIALMAASALLAVRRRRATAHV